jgi:UDP-GlcNAc3NAcA epimerase
MLKILTVIGARPQIIKAAAISRAIKNSFSEKLAEVIIHTGQHYDNNMSEVFFDELQIPKPAYNLNIGSLSHGKQTAGMISGIEEILLKEKPECVLVYGDTNSTLAAAVAASKIHIPIVHVEAGLRSFNKSMPEEINRIICDHVSTLLMIPTESARTNLVNEGFGGDSFNKNAGINNPKVIHSGDVMYDNSLYFASIARKIDNVQGIGLKNNSYILATIHRDNNTDQPERLNAFFSAFNKISKESGIQIILPLHPRTAKLLESKLNKAIYEVSINNSLIRMIEPASFIEITALEIHAKMLITDSGGLQKEAFFFQKPCIILRPETEWIELVENGNAILADADEERIYSAFTHFINMGNSLTYPPFYGDGRAAEKICEEILNHIHT